MVRSFGGMFQNHLGMVLSTSSPNFGVIADDLQSVLDQIVSWRSLLPVNETGDSEMKLSAIIASVRQFADDPSMETVVTGLKTDLTTEITKREKLEKEVITLKSQVAALSVQQADSVVINNLMDVMHLLKNFIFRVEMKTGHYSQTFKKCNDKDVVDSLFPEPLNLLDSADEAQRKALLTTLQPESTLMCTNLGIDCQLVFQLNKRVQSRNAATHFMDNSGQAKLNLTYIDSKLKMFEESIKSLDTSSELNSMRGDIDDFVCTLRKLYPIAVQKFSNMKP
jgi:hypothetical protein